MKVADIMHRQVDFVNTETSVKDVSRLIFGRGINGVPVCKGKKVVGFITERDILAHFYPSLQEYIEDPVHLRDFEAMEERIDEIFALPARKIMSTHPTTISASTPALKAQSLMFSHKVGRLPVIDERGRLVGIVSKKDVFKAIVGRKVPHGGEEKFYDWLARQYDLVVDWNKRLSQEIPSLKKLFQQAGAKKILDIASSTGEHTIALAKEGFHVVGLETSSVMVQLAEEKRRRLPRHVQARITFIQGGYETSIPHVQSSFHAAIFMGNALSHVIYTDSHILEEVSRLLDPRKSLILLQVVNYQKLFQTQSGFQDFTITKPSKAHPHTHVFLGFYTKTDHKETVYTRAGLSLEGNKWVFRGMNSTLITLMGQKEITSLFKKLKFQTISFYDAKSDGPLLDKPFAPLESDWLNVVAKRKG